MTTDTGKQGSATWGGIALMVIATILLIVTSLGYWLKSTVLDSDEFSDKVSEVLARPEATDRIGQVLADQALSSSEIQMRLESQLPENAAFLPVLLEAPLSEITARGISRFLALDATQNLVNTAVRDLHGRVVATLEGRGERLRVEDDSLVLDLGSVATGFLDRLGINPPQGGADGDFGEVVLVEDSKELDLAGTIVRVIDDAVPFLLIGSVVAYGGAVALYRDRPRGITVAGYTIVFAGFFCLLAWWIGGWATEAFLEERPVANMLIDSLASNLRVQSIALIVLGGAIALLSDERIRGWLAEVGTGAKSQVEAFGVGRTLLLGAAGVAVLAIIT
jgi:hypothetical protein